MRKYFVGNYIYFVLPLELMVLADSGNGGLLAAVKTTNVRAQKGGAQSRPSSWMCRSVPDMPLCIRNLVLSLSL